MRIGMIGLALSHPYKFAELMSERADVEFHVCDPEPPRVATFVAAHRGTTVHRGADAVVSAGVDAVMVCSEADRHVQDARGAIEAGVPTFVDKVMAITPADLDTFDDLVSRTGTPVLSSSALRFGSPYVALANEVRDGRLGTVTAATATVTHGIESYLVPGNTWQDEIDRGGGTLVNMGIHGVELVTAVAGAGARRVWATGGRRAIPATRSEDTAMITIEYSDGRVASVHVDCGSARPGRYAVSVFGSQAEAGTDLSRSEDPPGVAVGYAGVVEHTLAMAEGADAPVPWEETREVIAVLLAARQAMTTGDAVRVA